MKTTENRYINRLRSSRPKLLDSYMKEKKGQYDDEEGGKVDKEVDAPESKPKMRKKEDQGGSEPQAFGGMEDSDEETLESLLPKKKRKLKKVMFS